MGECAVSLPMDLTGQQGLPKILPGTPGSPQHRRKSPQSWQQSHTAAPCQDTARVAPTTMGIRGLLGDMSTPGWSLGHVVAIPLPAWLPQGGAKLPTAPYISCPLVDNIDVDIIERIDLGCCIAGLGVQWHHHKLLHLCQTGGHQPPAWVQHPGREWGPQRTTPGQASATTQEKLLRERVCWLLWSAHPPGQDLQQGAASLCTSFGVWCLLPTIFLSHRGFWKEMGGREMEECVRPGELLRRWR